MKELIHRYGAGIVLALVFLGTIGLPLLGEAILMERWDFCRNDARAWHRPLRRVGGDTGSTIGFCIRDRYGYPQLLRYGSYVGLSETRIKIAHLSVLASWNGRCAH
jgi:hypothetical protein